MKRLWLDVRCPECAAAAGEFCYSDELPRSKYIEETPYPHRRRLDLYEASVALLNELEKDQ